jgi:chromosomal replication initiation ATPase DnaA
VAAQQIPLPLQHRAAQGRADFLVAPSNADAVALIDRWPNWPGHALLITGPPGSGKSHLAEVWRAQSGAQSPDAQTLAAALVPQLLGANALILDRADEIRDEAALFHLLNFASAQETSLLLLARTLPETWPLTRPDLASRLKGLTRATLAPPDETLLEGLLLKLMADRQIEPVPPEVIAFIVERVEHSYAAAERVVSALDRESLARKRPVTLAIARTALASLDP